MGTAGMTIAKRAGRILVWPTWDIAAAEDTEVSKVIGRMTVWPTSGLARENMDSEGGGDSYVAKAVHFDADTYLSIPSLTAADSPYFSFAMWVRNTASAEVAW